MSIKFVESVKKYLARNLTVLENQKINKILYPVDPKHTAESIQTVKARGIIPPQIKVGDVKQFRVKFNKNNCN